MPKVEHGGGATGGGLPVAGFTDNSDPFEDDLEDALCVFKAGDSTSDALEKNAPLIMFYIDLENEQIVDKRDNEEAKAN